ncbi:MAG: protein TolQ [Candidatus Paracaedibacteraceae bacterium]|jgi:biopolymer transport protein TolQ|nr:protein TolQ [Candidatus Paracaedibacteraceae bacterium]
MDPQTLQAVNSQVLAATPATTDHSLSMLDMFWGADPIIKLVMLALIAASFWSWTIIFQKTMRLRKLTEAADQFEDAFWSGGALDDLYDRINNRPQDPLSSTFCAAMKEWRRSVSKGLAKASDSRGTMQQRIERVMGLTINREMEDLERYLGFLASTGSTAPFVGLFGTVLGIMNSFQSIAVQQNTNLAVVAPGIAEALFATAIGLVAAIPAVIAYNKLSSDMNRYANRLEAFAGEFSGIISRQLEEGAA